MKGWLIDNSRCANGIKEVMRVRIVACLFMLILSFGGTSVCGEELDISKKYGPFHKQIRYVVLHHTEFSSEEFPYQFDIVNRYHKEKFHVGPSSLGFWTGYNFFCERNGKLIQARLLGEETAAQLEHNYDSISICLAGNFNKERPTKAQIATLKKFLSLMPDKYEFVFHRDLADRTCPGRNISRAWISKLMGEKWISAQAKLSNKEKGREVKKRPASATIEEILQRYRNKKIISKEALNASPR